VGGDGREREREKRRERKKEKECGCLEVACLKEYVQEYVQEYMYRNRRQIRQVEELLLCLGFEQTTTGVACTLYLVPCHAIPSPIIILFVIIFIVIMYLHICIHMEGWRSPSSGPASYEDCPTKKHQPSRWYGCT